jgi:hypothetical protein
VAKVKSVAGRVLIPVVLGLSLAGCVVAEPAPPPSYAYYPSYGYYAPAYPYGGGYSSFGFSYNSGGWDRHRWHGRDWR